MKILLACYALDKINTNHLVRNNYMFYFEHYLLSLNKQL